MENIRVFVTRIPQHPRECPFYRSEVIETDHRYYCILGKCDACRLDVDEPCDMLELGMKINDMRF